MRKACPTGRLGIRSSALLGAGVMLFLGAFFFSACAPPKADEEMQKEVQALKAAVSALQEQVTRLEAEHKQLQEAVQGLQKAREAAPALPLPPALAPPAPSPALEALTVSELLKDKDRFIGSRVTVKGDPGPVLMHKKILYLQAPEGLVEVFFGNLTDKKQIERLSAQAIDQPLTVTGVLAAAPGTAKDPTRLQIMAESVDF